MSSKVIFLIFLGFILLLLSSCAARHTHFMDTLNLKGIKDGTYIGKDSVAIPPCSVRLATTVEDAKITEIKILSHFVSYPLAGRAYDIIPKRIIEKQSLDVDAVTMATVSSNNIKSAVFKALEKGR